MKLRVVTRWGSTHVFNTTWHGAVYLATILAGLTSARSVHITVPRVDPDLVDWFCIWYREQGSTNLTFVEGLPSFPATFRDAILKQESFS